MKDAAPKSIIELVERFRDHADAYHAGKYNETQIRREFLDPLFKALGWDVDNSQGYAEAYKEVIHEDAIKIGGSTKAPDYCFRIGGVRKFFVEAKKPSVDIKGDAAPAFQLRRYAWSAKLPLSILTDFEELAVYDCRVRPVKTDKPSKARTLYFRYDELPQRWEELAAIFSKDAILKGSFDKYAESAKRKHGTAEVDDAFLAEIENWRKTLAHNIALRNPKLSQRELNFSVQRTIDRIVFLRICEDRGIEEYKTLQALMNGSEVYKRLFERFRRADERYNSGLFHFDKEKNRPEAPDDLTPSLKIDDKPLKDILRRLYYPESPYEFSVLPADILGQVYEQFLGKVIRLTSGHQARVEEKPEVRKAGGVYYTPTYIVDYIVKHTVGKLVEGKTPRQVGALTETYQPSKAKGARPLAILDPACGSGSFLLGAYQFLLDWYRDAYIEEGPAKHTRGKNPRLYLRASGEWRLTTAERKRILLSHVYGVDIDSQAVETTKLSLLLKVLEGETGETIGSNLRLFHQRALPDLANNIKCGNSLIGPDFYEGRQMNLFDKEERLKINVFDWNAEFKSIMSSGGFHAVIGNPPYGAFFSENDIEYINKATVLQSYQLDSYLIFIEKGLSLLSFSGRFGMIIPNTWLLNIYSNNLRQFIFQKTQVKEIVHYKKSVFPKVTVDTQILLIKKINPQSNTNVKISIIQKNNHIDSYEILQSNWNDGIPVNIFMRPEFVELSKKLNLFPKLSEIASVTQGCKPFQVGKGKPPQTRDIVTQKPYVSKNKKDKSFIPLLRGSLIHRFNIRWSNDYFISFGDWLAEPRYSAGYNKPKKIIIRQTGDSLIATLDSKKFIIRDNLYAIHVFDGCNISYEYLLGCINSKLLNWFYRNVINYEKGEALAQVKRSHLVRLPIRTMSINDLSVKTRHDQMVSLVQTMLDLHKELGKAKTAHGKTVVQRQIDATDKQIDQLVYELYGLTEEEIRIVEEATK